jgi:hypothetical protein
LFGLEGIEICMNGFVQDFVSNKPIIPFVWPIIKGTCLTPSEIEVLEEEGFCLTKVGMVSLQMTFHCLPKDHLLHQSGKVYVMVRL